MSTSWQPGTRYPATAVNAGVGWPSYLHHPFATSDHYECENEDDADGTRECPARGDDATSVWEVYSWGLGIQFRMMSPHSVDVIGGGAARAFLVRRRLIYLIPGIFSLAFR